MTRKKIFILGYGGNMGSRYRAILKYLGYDWDGFDVYLDEVFPDGAPPADLDKRIMDSDGVIIATHTAEHLKNICHLARLQYIGPVLCEKPISVISNQSQWDDLQKLMTTGFLNLSMVSQYDYLVKPDDVGDTELDWFSTGKDGVYWDCINIIWHAKGPIKISRSSPIWRCKINGRVLSIADMDQAYIKMIDSWINSAPTDGRQRILAAHAKVLGYINGLS